MLDENYEHLSHSFSSFATREEKQAASGYLGLIAFALRMRVFLRWYSCGTSPMQSSGRGKKTLVK